MNRVRKTVKFRGLRNLVTSAFVFLFLLSTLYLVVNGVLLGKLDIRSQADVADSSPLNCQVVVGLGETVIDARKEPYNSVKPGDTVCLEAGKRDKLVIKNFKGNKNKVITFTNFGGKVFLVYKQPTGNSHEIAIDIQNSRYFRLIGNVDPSYVYGIRVNGDYQFGIQARNRSSDFEMDHIGIFNTRQPGIHTGTRPNCPDGNDDNMYDYDNDGVTRGDLDDVTTQDNFIQSNTVIHHLNLQNVGWEGLYIGLPYTRADLSYNPDNPTKCIDSNGREYRPLSPVLSGVTIYDNVVNGSGREGIEVKGAPDGNCKIYKNKVDDYGRNNEGYGQIQGIAVSYNAACEVDHNTVGSGVGEKIKDREGRSSVHDNNL